jgi:hypothetical protein
MIRNDAVGIATSNGLSNRQIKFKNISSSHDWDQRSVTPASYAMGTGGSFSEVKAAGA